MKKFYALLILSIPFVMNAALQAQATYELDPFDEIRVSGNIELELIKGESESAVIDARSVNESDIKVEVEQGQLKISTLKKLFSDNASITARVTYRQLRELDALAGARVRAAEDISGDKFELSAGSGAEVNLSFRVNSLEANASEGGRIQVRGETESLEVNASTGGSFEGDKLPARRTYVKASTGGRASVVALERIIATASLGGTIAYSGNPEKRELKTNLAGDIYESEM